LAVLYGADSVHLQFLYPVSNSIPNIDMSPIYIIWQRGSGDKMAFRWIMLRV